MRADNVHFHWLCVVDEMKKILCLWLLFFLINSDCVTSINQSDLDAGRTSDVDSGRTVTSVKLANEIEIVPQIL